jgi:hypothetical protein
MTTSPTSLTAAQCGVTAGSRKLKQSQDDAEYDGVDFASLGLRETKLLTSGLADIADALRRMALTHRR